MFNIIRPSICAMIWSLVKPVPVIAPAGQAATQVPQPWQRAGLISVTMRSSWKADGVEWTQAVADAAAGTFFFDHAGAHGFERHFFLFDLAEHTCCRGRTLRDAGGDIFWPLRAAGNVNAFGHGRDRVELGMFLGEPAVGGAGNAEHLGSLIGVFAWFKARGQNDHIHRDAALFAGQRVFHLDDEFSLFARGCAARPVTSATLPRTKSVPSSSTR